jgi:MFS family permease
VSSRIFRRSSPEYGWIVVAAITTVLTATAGTRFLFGVVLKPLHEEFGWSRSALSFATTINMLALCAFQPLIGKLCDRVGTKLLMLGGTLILGLSLIPLSYVTELWQIYLIYGVVMAAGLAAVSPVNITPLVSRWFTVRRGTALAVATSGAAFGQLIIVPLAAWSLSMTGWQAPYRLLSIVLLVVMLPIAAFLIREPPSDRVEETPALDSTSEPGSNVTEGIGLRDALRLPPFWLLAFGFFVCGFTMAFANIHFLAYADDMGMSEMRAADVVAATAVCSIFGSIGLGLLADRRSRPHILGLTYLLRGLSFLLLLALPKDNLIFFYSLVLGISWTATTPLTAAISADMFGRQHLGVIFGTMFTFMNLGMGVGSLLDGVIYDMSGGYNIALVINGALGVMAAVAVVGVPDMRMRRGLARVHGETPFEVIPTPAD